MIDRALEFFTPDELTMQVGHEQELWPLVLVKELVDNALDACEEAGITPIIAVSVKKDSIAVWDNGPGLPASTVERSLDYRIRVSNKTRYVSPTRGQLGNALKCVWAALFVVDGKSGRVEVIARGLRHTVTVRVDPLRGVPDIRHTTRPFVKNGTFIKIHWPEIASYPDLEEESGFYKSALGLLNQYALFNPHATFILKCPSQRQRLSASDPGWSKWLASDPTSPWWYRPDDLRSLIAGYVVEEEAGRAPRTVREFVSEFQGLKASAKQKVVTESAGLSRASLRDLVGEDGVMSHVDSLLGAMRKHSRAVNPKALGVIGADHLRRILAGQFGTDPECFFYKKVEGVAGDLPFVIEAAFAYAVHEERSRVILAGLNFLPVLKIPFPSLHWRLGECRVDSFDPVVFVVHVACPRFKFIERGKGAAYIPEEMKIALNACVDSVTKEWKAAKRRADRENRVRKRLPRLLFLLKWRPRLLWLLISCPGEQRTLVTICEGTFKKNRDGMIAVFQDTQAKVAYLGICLFMVGCSFILGPVARADTSGFPTEPILRLTPETYMARITNFSVDEQGQFIATGHSDKTVCLWDLQTGRLERVLRVPLGPRVGDVGAVALSPEGRQVAVVAKSWDGDFIYVFDGLSGRLEHRIKKDLGSYLTYSPDGRYLAATTRPSRSATGHAVGGLSVYETSHYRTIGQDIDNSGWADFDRNNRLVTIGWNGDIRLYAAGEYSRPYLTRERPGGRFFFSPVRSPFDSVTFSPDGEFIALAYSDSTEVDVVSAKTLTRAYSPNTERLGNGAVYRVDWSPDGRYLYAGAERYAHADTGKYTPGSNIVIRWSQAGRGDIAEYSLAEDEMIGTLMGDRLLVIGAKHPLLALNDADGKKRWVRRSEGANFKHQEGRDDPGLALSRTGDIVEFGFQRFGLRRAWFDLRTPRLAFEPPTDASLAGPLLAAPGLAVTGWTYGGYVYFNGKPLHLWGSHALAIAPDHKRFVVAGEGIWVFDASGRGLGSTYEPEAKVTWAVNITPDGRKVVAGFNDGTLRWYELGVKQLSEAEKAERRDRAHSERNRFSQHELSEPYELLEEVSAEGGDPSVVANLSELLALYALPDGRWVLWTPSGYYQASAGAEELISRRS